MKLRNAFISLSILASTALAGDPASESECSRMFYDGGLLIPDASAPAYKQKLFEKTGTAFQLELFGGYWAIDHQAPGYNDDCYLGLLYGRVDQRIIKNDLHGGTWFNLAVSGSWGLNHDSADKDRFYDGGMGICTGQHTDSVGAAGLYILNATLRQYFNHKRTCLNVGSIWMSMYFDRIDHARFANDSFEKSPVLPMYYGTPGAVLQHEIDKSNFVTAAFIGTGLGLGDNPLNWNNTDGYAVQVEYGHHFAEGQGTWRVASFFCSQDTPDNDGKDVQHDSVGLMGGVEYNISDRVKVYGRLSCASSEHQRARKEAMVGTTLRLVPSRPDDYLGAAFGVYKGADKAGCRLVNAYEKVLELTYRVNINEYLSLAPFYQLYIDPAYRSVSTVSATGVQAHLLF